jgi:hypothetical protein
MRLTTTLATFAVLFAAPALASAQDAGPPYECDDQVGECGMPEQSHGGCGCGCGGIDGGTLIPDECADADFVYQYADDFDDDAIEDFYDNCAYVANRDQANSDGDVMGDACDNCVALHNEVQTDTDGDGLGDECDDDLDGDGLANDVDDCPYVANPAVGGEQPDLDGDWTGDACDADDDADGYVDLEDNCPLIFNPLQETIVGDRCYGDTDGDGIYDHVDNCVAGHNPEQVDTDEDLLGDECDSDLDGDGVLNSLDNCPMVPQEAQIDLDRDGVGEECDDRYCYVVMGDAEHCLDPDASFSVYSPSPLEAETGEVVRLRLFANRENAPLQYRWSVIQAPVGSRASVETSEGSVRLSTPFEYRYAEDPCPPTITPDEPGEYVLRLEATQTWEDQVSGEVGETSEALLSLTVTGRPPRRVESWGCAVLPGAPMYGSLGLLAAFALLAARRLRRRR